MNDRKEYQIVREKARRKTGLFQTADLSKRVNHFDGWALQELIYLTFAHCNNIVLPPVISASVPILSNHFCKKLGKHKKAIFDRVQFS